MSELADEAVGKRPSLSRDRVLLGAMAVADAGGLESLTMRSLAQHLDAKPMSLYYYVAGKDKILDGIVDLVFAEIDLPSAEGEWQQQMVRRGTRPVGRCSATLGPSA